MKLVALVPLLAAGALALPGVPRDLQGYKSWHRVNAKPIADQAASAHPGLKNVYASKRAVRGRYPYGAVVVKEGLRADRTGKRFVALIAVMRKQRGADPRHGDWRFVEYTRSSPKGRFREIARDGICWSCHMQARKTDWVFTTR